MAIAGSPATVVGPRSSKQTAELGINYLLSYLFFRRHDAGGGTLRSHRIVSVPR